MEMPEYLRLGQNTSSLFVQERSDWLQNAGLSFVIDTCRRSPWGGSSWKKAQNPVRLGARHLSSVGRAPLSQSGGPEFNSRRWLQDRNTSVLLYEALMESDICL